MCGPGGLFAVPSQVAILRHRDHLLLDLSRHQLMTQRQMHLEQHRSKVMVSRRVAEPQKLMRALPLPVTQQSS